jgi:DNA-directed RNA polymerase specialized sigma24 family protein
MSHDDLYCALVALRDAPDVRAHGLAPSWQRVLSALQGFGRSVGSGPLVDREEVVSISLVKVQRNIQQLTADNAAGARGWLRRIYERTYLDVARARRRRRRLFVESDLTESPEAIDLVDPARAPEADFDPAKLDAKVLAPYVDRLFDRVDAYVETKVRRIHRLDARRRAQLAYAYYVSRTPKEQLLAELQGAAGGKPVSADAFAQWTRRGRVDVLIPVLARWLEELKRDHTEASVAAPAEPPAPHSSESTAEHAFVTELLEILRARTRSDAGQPRPARRSAAPEEGT